MIYIITPPPFFFLKPKVPSFKKGRGTHTHINRYDLWPHPSCLFSSCLFSKCRDFDKVIVFKHSWEGISLKFDSMTKLLSVWGLAGGVVFVLEQASLITKAVSYWQFPYGPLALECDRMSQSVAACSEHSDEQCRTSWVLLFCFKFRK